MMTNNNAVIWVTTACIKISGKVPHPSLGKNNHEGGGSNFLLEERPVISEGDNIGHCEEKKGSY
jgi:hypothetical protein